MFVSASFARSPEGFCGPSDIVSSPALLKAEVHLRHSKWTTTTHIWDKASSLFKIGFRLNYMKSLCIIISFIHFAVHSWKCHPDKIFKNDEQPHACHVRTDCTAIHRESTSADIAPLSSHSKTKRSHLCLEITNSCPNKYGSRMWCTLNLLI